MLLASANFSGLLYYVVATGCGPIEALRWMVGVTALWGPLWLLLYWLLASQVPDRIVRASLCAAASYALTTLTYFALAVVQLEPVFYVLQVGVVTALAVRLRRDRVWRRLASASRYWQEIDWPLLTLITLSLILNIPYKMPMQYSPGIVTFGLYEDHLYHVGQAYELARHVPPRQQVIRAGVPERAYHMFSHLTTMLLGRYTGQRDLMRAHLLYHYTTIEVGLCLLMFSIAATLTASRGAGYVAVALLYVTAVAWPPFGPHPFPYFYFTLFPHVSSGLNPVRMTCPQMYSGLLVTYGVLLGVLLASIRLYRRQRVDALLVVVALMVASTSRFRVHVFLPLLPGFLLICVAAWWQRRDRACLIAAAIALVGALLLLLETRSPVYLPGTAKLTIAYNAISLNDWINTWPLAPAARKWVSGSFADRDVRKWTWQCLSLSAFVLLNMIGVPLLGATIATLFRAQAFREWLWFTFLTLWLVVASTVGAMLVTMGYDSYSVGGQLLLHTRWYVFPFAATAIWALYSAAQRRVKWPERIWVGIGVVVAGVCVGMQLRTPTGGVQWVSMAEKLQFETDEWRALQELREHTAVDAVILSNRYAARHTCVFSGLAGRAAYVEGGDNVVAQQALRVNPVDDRQRRVVRLWEATDPRQFCTLLSTTGATHLVEFADSPLQVHGPPCLRRLWDSPRQRVTIWETRPK